MDFLPKKNKNNSQTETILQGESEDIGAKELIFETESESHILTPGFDFTPGDNVSGEELLARFPIREKESSEISFIDVADFFTARIKLLDQATKSVRLQTLTFWGDESGYFLSQKLMNLAKKGIKVQIIIDPLSNFRLKDRKLYLQLTQNGITIEGYEMLFANFLAGIKECDTDFTCMFDNLNMRYHEKLFIIDGEIPEKAQAIIGGANISNEYFRVDPSKPIKMYTDRDVLTKGEIVSDMTRNFDKNLIEFKSKKQILMQDSTFRTALNTHLSEAVEDIVGDLDPAITSRLETLAKKPFETQWINAKMRFIQSRPRFKEDFIFPAYIDLINNAKEEIFITNGFFIPEDPLVNALVSAAERGVKVRILCNSTDSLYIFPFLAIAGRIRYKDLLIVNNRAGNPDLLKIYEWGGDKGLHNGEGENHSKYAVFDKKLVLVGSYNLDQRSHFLNSESVVVTRNSNLAQSFIQEFNKGITPYYSVNVSYQDSLKFDDPEGILSKLELAISKAITFLL